MWIKLPRAQKNPTRKLEQSIPSDISGKLTHFSIFFFVDAVCYNVEVCKARCHMQTLLLSHDVQGTSICSYMMFTNLHGSF